MDILKSCLAIRGRARVQKGRANTGQAGLINVWINKSRIADGGDQQTKDEVSRVMIGILDRCLQKIIWHCSSSESLRLVPLPLLNEAAEHKLVH
jgi:hypothetical protein